MNRFIYLVSFFAAALFSIGATIIVQGPANFPSGASAYEIREDFNGGSGTTPPSGWSADPTPVGTWNFSNTSPASPQGGNNVSMSSGAANYYYKTFTARGETWGFYLFRTTNLS